ncbi:MAG TPA: hypothetical protein VIO39_06880 [Methylotenera sp.]
MNFKLSKSIAHALALASLTLSLNHLAHADEQSVNDISRGKLLYSLHCIACHTEQKHWLANKKVSDWPSLVSQVRLWQSISNLKWDKHDIESVAKHLNALYYHYPLPDTVARKK